MVGFGSALGHSGSGFVYFLTEFFNLRDSPIDPAFLDSSRVEIRTRRHLDSKWARSMEGGHEGLEGDCWIREYGGFDSPETAREGIAHLIGEVRDRTHPLTDFSDCVYSPGTICIYKIGAFVPMSADSTGDWVRRQCRRMINGSESNRDLVWKLAELVDRANQAGFQPCLLTTEAALFELRDAARSGQIGGHSNGGPA